MELILIRHTTPDIPEGICYGQTDLDIKTSFKEEAIQIQKQLKAFDALYSSPLKRCRILAETLGENIRFDRRLMEVNFGDWEMMAWDHIPKEEIQPWYDDYVHYPAKHGESLMDVFKRVTSFLECIKKLHPNERIVCVTHATVIRIIHGIKHHISLRDIFDLKINYGELLFI